jgi:butyryl-CoA dehydrogenase
MKNAITIVTGAASGIGRHVAIQAAERGSQVIATDINESGLAETQTLAKARGCVIQIRRLDVSNAGAIQAFAETMIPTLQNKKLFLINNAGVALAAGPFSATPLPDFEWLLDVNLYGVIRMTKAFLPYMLEHNEGRIVNVSSIFGLGGVRFQSAYCTSKFGVHGFNEALRVELADTNIKVTGVHPGGVKTSIAENARLAGDYITPEEKRETAKKFAANTWTRPETAARQILDAAEKGRARLLIGADAKFLATLIRLLPVTYINVLRKISDHVFGIPGKSRK